MKRNNTVDIIRGFAMLMVVLGHTMMVSTIDSESTFPFQVVWSLQMPLFFLISGYVTRYSHAVKTLSDFGRVTFKRTLSYLLPWMVWTFIVRAFILGQSNFFDLKYLFWHMDTGYWFLVSLWTITVVVFGIPNWICSQLKLKNFYSRIIILFIGCLVMMTGLVVLGLFAGLNFFSIKYSLYYTPIFLTGWFFGQLQDSLTSFKEWNKLKDCFFIICLTVWLFVILRVNFYESADDFISIMLRYITSLAGCIFVIYCFANIDKSNRLVSVFQTTGKLSLEIYLSHFLFLNLIKPTNLAHISSMNGLIDLCVNYLLSVSLTMGIIILLKKNKMLDLILFYKR